MAVAHGHSWLSASSPPVIPKQEIEGQYSWKSKYPIKTLQVFYIIKSPIVSIVWWPFNLLLLHLLPHWKNSNELVSLDFSGIWILIVNWPWVTVKPSYFQFKFLKKCIGSSILDVRHWHELIFKFLMEQFFNLWLRSVLKFQWGSKYSEKRITDTN